jgi:hypothetical protein
MSFVSFVYLFNFFFLFRMVGISGGLSLAEHAHPSLKDSADKVIVFCFCFFIFKMKIKFVVVTSKLVNCKLSLLYLLSCSVSCTVFSWL